MVDVAAGIFQAIARTVPYVDISPEERRRVLLANGVSTDFPDALDERVAERRKSPESRVHLKTHEMFGVEPTTFSILRSATKRSSEARHQLVRRRQRARLLAGRDMEIGLRDHEDKLERFEGERVAPLPHPNDHDYVEHEGARI
jgi:hypothetical protein